MKEAIYFVSCLTLSAHLYYLLIGTVAVLLSLFTTATAAQIPDEAEERVQSSE